MKILNWLRESTGHTEDLWTLSFIHFKNLLLVRQLRRQNIGLMIHAYHRCHGYTNWHVLSVKFWESHHGHIELRESLAMTHIWDFALASLLHHVIPESWLVVEAELVEGEVPVALDLGFYIFQLFTLIIYIIKLMLLWELATSRIIQPNIKPRIDEPKTYRVFPIKYPAAGWV